MSVCRPYAFSSSDTTGPTEAKAVITHAVDVGNDQAGKRWVEFGFSNGQAFANPNGVFANVAVSNMGTNDAPYILRMKEGEDWTFFNYGKSITYSWGGPVGTGEEVTFRAVSVSATDDPAVRAFQQQMREAGHFQR